MGLSARQSLSRDSIVSPVMGDLSPTTNNETASLEFSPLQHILTGRNPSGLGSGRRQLPLTCMDVAIFRVSSVRYRTVTLVTVSNPFQSTPVLKDPASAHEVFASAFQSLEINRKVLSNSSFLPCCSQKAEGSFSFEKRSRFLHQLRRVDPYPRPPQVRRGYSPGLPDDGRPCVSATMD